MSTAKEEGMEMKLYNVAINLMKKINELRNEKKCNIDTELRNIVELVLQGTNPASLHDNFKINIYQFLGHIVTFSDTRLQQLGVPLKTRLLCKLVLQLLVLKNIQLYIDKTNKQSIFGYSNNLMQRFSTQYTDPLTELLFDGLTRHDYTTSFISKHALLTLPSVLNDNNSWTQEEMGDISKKLGQILLVHCNNDQKKLTYKKRSNFKIPVFSELDGASARGIFTVLNLASNLQQDTLLNIYMFSILKSWLMYLDSKNKLTDCLNFQLNKYSSDANMAASGSPMSVGGSQFYADLSSDSDSYASLTSSMSSLQSFTANDDNDQFDGKKKPRSQTPLRFNEARPQTPLRFNESHPTSQFDTISITSDIISNASNLRNIVTRYCLRIIQQSEKIPRHNSDRSIITSSTVECINILHLICKEDTSVSQKIYVAVKRLYKRIETDPLSARRVYVGLIQFFIYHHEEMLISIDEILDSYFSLVPDILYHKQSAVFELIHLCVDNLDFLKRKTEFLSKYIQNFLKLFVWWPITFLENTIDILNLTLTSSNILEMFHSILDLPTLAVLMDLRHNKLLSDESKLEDALKVEIKPYYHSMFSFILRRKSSGADTIDKLSELYKAFQQYSQHPRVKYALQLVPSLLLEFFDSLYSMEDKTLLKHVFPVLLERVFLLYPIDGNHKEVYEILCDQIVNISKIVPSVIQENFDELLAFLMQLQISLVYFPCLVIKIVWCIGEFSSNGFCERVQVTSFYETLEMFLYESLQKLGEDIHNMNHPEVVTSLVIALSKLASYSQELIPRLTVCFNKLLSIEFDTVSVGFSWVQYKSIIQLTHQLIKVLQKPNVAPAVLCNISRHTPWHLDKHNSLLLQVHVLLNGNTKDAA